MEVIDKLAWVHIRDRRVMYARSKGKELFFNPGGKREGNETDEEALAREVKEEFGVDLISGTERLYETFEAPAHGKPEGTFVRSACYFAQCIGEPSPSTEIEEIAWFTSADRARTTLMGQKILDKLVFDGIVD
jgi:8-oxo-dGTP diphosphatase